MSEQYAMSYNNKLVLKQQKYEAYQPSSETSSAFETNHVVLVKHSS